MKESAILVQRFGVHTIVFPSAMVAYQGYYSIAALWEQVKNRQCSGRFRTLSSGARQEPAKPAGGVPATSRVQKHKERPPAQTCADRGSALRGLRCPPRHVHDEAGQVVTHSVHSLAETGIPAVNERLESAPQSGSPATIRTYAASCGRTWASSDWYAWTQHGWRGGRHTYPIACSTNRC